MGRFEVDAAELTGTAATVQTAAGTVADSVAGMHRVLVALQATWRGSASAQFSGAVAQWHTASTQLDEVLRALVTSVQAAAAAYEDAESQATRLFVVR